MLEFASLGAKVLHNRSVEMAETVWSETGGAFQLDESGGDNH